MVAGGLEDAVVHVRAGAASAVPDGVRTSDIIICMLCIIRFVIIISISIIISCITITITITSTSTSTSTSIIIIIIITVTVPVLGRHHRLPFPSSPFSSPSLVSLFLSPRYGL